MKRKLDAKVIAVEPLSLVVRRGHPLLVQPQIAVGDLLRFDWVMGDDETLLTQTVVNRLAELGLPLPKRRISTSSFLFTLALLNQTDAIAPLATPVVDSFAGNPSVPVRVAARSTWACRSRRSVWSRGRGRR